MPVIFGLIAGTWPGDASRVPSKDHRRLVQQTLQGATALHEALMAVRQTPSQPPQMPKRILETSQNCETTRNTFAAGLERPSRRVDGLEGSARLEVRVRSDVRHAYARGRCRRTQPPWRSILCPDAPAAF